MKPVVRCAWMVGCVFTVFACGDDAAGGPAEDGAQEDGGPGTEQPGDGDGVGDGDGNPGGCTDLRSNYLLEPTALEQNDDDRSPISSISADADSVYFSTPIAMYRMPLSGGAPVKLFEQDLEAIYMSQWMRDEDVIALSGSRVWSVAKSSGMPTMLPAFDHHPTSVLSAAPFTALVGDRIFAKEQAGGFGAPERVTYFSHELSTGAETVLLETDKTYNRRFAVAGDFLYTTHDEGEGGGLGEDTFVSTLLRIPLAGGEATELTVTPAMERQFMVLAAAGDQLILFARPKGGLNYEFARVSTETGELVSLGATTHTAFGTPSIEVQRGSGATVVNTVSEFYYIADDAGEVVRFSCADGTVNGFTIHGSDVLASVYDDVAQTNAIVRIPLPR